MPQRRARRCSFKARQGQLFHESPSPRRGEWLSALGFTWISPVHVSQSFPLSNMPVEARVARRWNSCTPADQIVANARRCAPRSSRPRCLPGIARHFQVKLGVTHHERFIRSHAKLRHQVQQHLRVRFGLSLVGGAATGEKRLQLGCLQLLAQPASALTGGDGQPITVPVQ